MATKRTNYAKCKVWGQDSTMNCEGSILGVMSMMLMMVPKEFQQKFLDHLQGEVTERMEKPDVV